MVINNDGAAEFYINGEYITKVNGAISTTTDISAYVGVGGTTTTVADCDLNYLYIKASRDWTR